MLGARIKAGRCTASITLAMVKVLPEPVTPSSTWSRSLPCKPATRSRMAAGWSPFGSKGETTWRARAGGGDGRRGGKNSTGVIWFIAHLIWSAAGV